MGFLFVDKILAIDPGRHVQGVKHVTLSEPYLYHASNGKLALLPSIIGETLGQLGAWGVMHANDFTLRPIAGVVAAVHIHDEAYVGDSIQLDTYIDNFDDKALQYHSVAKVKGTPIFEIESALGPMLPVELFTDLAVAKQQFANIYRPGEVMVDMRPKTALVNQPQVNYLNNAALFDNIIELVPNQYALAEKLVSLSAPYFSDHFPLKPVLPLTILLNCKLQLAKHFLEQSLGAESRNFKATTLRKIKMKDFVYPGDVLTATVEIKQQSSHEIILALRSEVAAKRVCVAEAVFTRIEV